MISRWNVDDFLTRRFTNRDKQEVSCHIWSAVNRCWKNVHKGNIHASSVPHSSLLEDILGMSNSFNNRFPGHTQENAGERRWGGIKWRIEESPFLPSPPYNPSFPPYFLLSFTEFRATVQKLFGIDQAASQFNNPCFHVSSIDARTSLICWGFVRFRGNKIHVGTFYLRCRSNPLHLHHETIMCIFMFRAP